MTAGCDKRSERRLRSTVYEDLCGTNLTRPDTLIANAKGECLLALLVDVAFEQLKIWEAIRLNKPLHLLAVLPRNQDRDH